jgi:hypothetical protein
MADHTHSKREMSQQSPLRSDHDDWLDTTIASLQDLVAEGGGDGPDARERADARFFRWRKRNRVSALGLSLRRPIRAARVGVASASPLTAASRLPIRSAATVVFIVRWGAAVVVAKRSEIAFYGITIGFAVALGAGIALLL